MRNPVFIGKILKIQKVSKWKCAIIDIKRILLVLVLVSNSQCTFEQQDSEIQKRNNNRTGHHQEPSLGSRKCFFWMKFYLEHQKTKSVYSVFSASFCLFFSVRQFLLFLWQDVISTLFVLKSDKLGLVVRSHFRPQSWWDRMITFLTMSFQLQGLDDHLNCPWKLLYAFRNGPLISVLGLGWYYVYGGGWYSAWKSGPSKSGFRLGCAFSAFPK